MLRRDVIRKDVELMLVKSNVGLLISAPVGHRLNALQTRIFQGRTGRIWITLQILSGGSISYQLSYWLSYLFNLTAILPL